MTDPVRTMTLEQLQQLFDNLLAQQYQLYGPVRREHAIMYEKIASLSDLPVGVQDEQRPGYYRLSDGHGEQLFAYTTSPDSWKKYLFPKEDLLYSVGQDNGQLMFKTQSQAKQKKAFIGMRSCDIHALGVQDRVFLEGQYVDERYAARRCDLLIVAVNCTRSVDTCFCASLNTGPAARSGFDLALTEVVDNGQHYFTVAIGSEAGRQLLAPLSLPLAAQTQLDAASAGVQQAAQQIRSLPTDQLKETIYAQLQNEAFWQDVGERCLHCANCTLVCPTCFCSSVEERTDLTGDDHQRVRYWDSCFNEAHSHIAGGSIRQDPNSRYRQWFSHKLATWQDQFDTLGCTGCGRCIAWCPVGIDLTQEAQRLRNVSIGEDAANG